DPEIPVLTDVVLPASPLFEPPGEPQGAPGREMVERASTAPRRGEPEQSPSVITRVQTQNLEHAVYLKLKSSLDQQIAQVIETRFLPAIGEALNDAVERMAQRLEAGVASQLQASLREALETAARGIHSA